MNTVTITGLFMLTELAEIIGCYFPDLWLRHGKPAWLLIPAAICLAAIAWLLTLHPMDGRTFAKFLSLPVSPDEAWQGGVADVADLMGITPGAKGAGQILPLNKAFFEGGRSRT